MKLLLSPQLAMDIRDEAATPLFLGNGSGEKAEINPLKVQKCFEKINQDCARTGPTPSAARLTLSSSFYAFPHNPASTGVSRIIMKQPHYFIFTPLASSAFLGFASRQKKKEKNSADDS